MADPLVPSTYEEWRRCITLLCDIPITTGFIDERLGAQNDPKDFRTKKYAPVWGERQRELTRTWFEQAKREWTV